MPEGPSILILKEKLERFKGKKVLAASGTAVIDMDRISGKKIIAFKSWGKHFIIAFRDFFLRIHLLMFGTYRINEHLVREPRLHLDFGKEKMINFYTCHVLLIEGKPEDRYDMEADVMSPTWNAAKALKKIKAKPAALICDSLLDQEIFSGVGNIIKNEVLFLAKTHPLSLVNALPPAKLKELVRYAESYTWDFYKWKKEKVLSKNFKVYERSTCPRCKHPLNKELLGKGKRLTYYCPNCQVNYRN